MLFRSNGKIVQTGKIQAMQTAVTVTKKFKDDEETKASTLRAARLAASEREKSNAYVDEPQDRFSRPVGVRPGMSIKERRLMEAQSEVQKNDAETSQKSIDNSMESSMSILKEESGKSKGKKKQKS